MYAELLDLAQSLLCKAATQLNLRKARPESTITYQKLRKRGSNAYENFPVIMEYSSI
jgi:hypothetical protein